MSASFKVIGILIILLSVMALLGFIGDNNPIAFISNPLLNLTKLFLSDTASLIFWITIILLGLALVGPKEGYMKTVIIRK